LFFCRLTSSSRVHTVPATVTSDASSVVCHQIKASSTPLSLLTYSFTFLLIYYCCYRHYYFWFLFSWPTFPRRKFTIGLSPRENFFGLPDALEPNSTTRTPATDTTNGQAHNNLQQICHIAMPEPNISTCQDVGMWQIFVRWWCPLVVFVAGVRSRCPCSGVWLFSVPTNSAQH